MSSIVSSARWVVVTVRKHIVPEEAGAGGGVAVGIQEALDDGVVISGLEVIEARLFDGEIAMRSKTGPRSCKNGVERR